MPTELVVAFAVGMVCFTVLLLLIEFAAEKRDVRRYPMPGRLATERRLHILEKGTGNPAVVLESGLVATSISWLPTQNAVAEFARVVAYDRAGLGWSAPGNKAPGLDELLAGLSAVVAVAGAGAAVIVVGHSFGGLIVSAFAHLHAEQVCGIVLVDPVSLETYAQPDPPHSKRLALAVRLSRRGAWLAHPGFVRGALWLVARGRKKLPLFIGRVSAGQGSSVINRLTAEIAKLPPEMHAPIRSQWSRPSSFRVLAQYLEMLPECARQAQAMPIPEHIPLVILSASTAALSELAERDNWARRHPASRHIQIADTTHWIQLDRPDVIGDAVKQLIIS